MLGRISPHQLFPTDWQSTFTKEVNHLHLGSIIPSLDAEFSSWRSHFPPSQGISDMGYHTFLCASLHCAASAQLFSTESCLTRKITQVPETHHGAFKVCYEASWNCPDISGILSWEHRGANTEHRDSKASLLLEESKQKQSNVLSGWCFSARFHFVLWEFLCWLFWVGFFFLLSLF